MYWTDYLQNAIFMSDLSGENVMTLVDTQLDVTGDNMKVKSRYLSL